jgi:hypothetical protein
MLINNLLVKERINNLLLFIKIQIKIIIIIIQNIIHESHEQVVNIHWICITFCIM